MLISTNKNPKIILMLAAIALTAATGITLGLFASDTSAYSKYCVTATCRAAADKAAASSVAAAEASSKADDLQSKIDSLNAEIAQKEAEIAENEAMRSDLEKQIKETEAKLERDKKAIRTLVVKTNQSESRTLGAIDVLASSDSVSDVVEEDNRQTSVEERLTEAAKQVKQDKQDLEEQKAAIQRTLDSNNAKKQEIAANRAEQAELKQKYENDAAGYQKAAAEAAAVVAAETAKQQQEAQRYASGGTAAVISRGYGASGWWGTNSYPYAASCPGINNTSGGAFGGNYCQCTSYAGWKLYERYGFNIYRHSTLSRWGNAKYWGDSAKKEGAHAFRVDNTPTAGSIGYTTGGSTGHVVWVESVNGNGTVNITEYNFSLVGDFGARQNVPASKFAGFIHY